MSGISERNAYVDKLQGRIDEFTADIDKLKAKARQAGASTRLEMHDQLAQLKAQRDDLAETLGDLADAGEETWEDSRDHAKEMASTIMEEIREVRRRLEIASTSSA